jgi:NAD/NADP transhydrogenase beta subunit
MPDSLLLLFALLAGAAGMAWFALAKLPHWQQVTGQQAQRQGTRRRLRLAGAMAVSVSLALCLLADHASMSFLVWIMIQAAAALGVAMVLAFRPRLLAALVFRTSS